MSNTFDYLTVVGVEAAVDFDCFLLASFYSTSSKIWTGIARRSLCIRIRDILIRKSSCLRTTFLILPANRRFRRVFRRGYVRALASGRDRRATGERSVDGRSTIRERPDLVTIFRYFYSTLNLGTLYLGVTVPFVSASELLYSMSTLSLCLSLKTKTSMERSKTFESQPPAYL